MLFTPGLLLIFTIGPLGEEAGWRGFLLPKLLERHNALTCSLLLGVIWGMWHFPLSFTSSSFEEIYRDPISWLSYSLLVICFSIQFTVIFLHTRSSLLIAMLFHWVINARYSVVAAMFPEATDEMWNVVRDAPNTLLIILIPWIVSTIGLVAIFRNSLFKTRSQTPSESSPV